VKLICLPLISSTALVATSNIYAQPDLFDGIGISPRHRIVPNKVRDMSEYVLVQCDRFRGAAKPTLFRRRRSIELPHDDLNILVKHSR